MFDQISGYCGLDKLTRNITFTDGNNPNAHQHFVWDKQNVVYTYNGKLFSLKKQLNYDTYYNMDEPWRHYAE